MDNNIRTDNIENANLVVSIKRVAVAVNGYRTADGNSTFTVAFIALVQDQLAIVMGINQDLQFSEIAFAFAKYVIGIYCR